MLLIWRAKKRRQAEMIDVTLQFSKIRNGIILLPEDVKSLPVALEKRLELIGLFNNTTFQYLVLNTHPAFDFPQDILANARIIEKQDLTFLGTPTKMLMNEYDGISFDLLVDFNADFNIFATYFASKCNAKLRVCLANPHREAFYNFQVNAFEAKTLTGKYDVLLKYLSKAISPAANPTTFQTV